MNIVINVKKKSLDKFEWAFLISWNGEKLLKHNKNLNLKSVTANVTLTDKMLNIKNRNKPRIRRYSQSLLLFNIILEVLATPLK